MDGANEAQSKAAAPDRAKPRFPSLANSVLLAPAADEKSWTPAGI